MREWLLRLRLPWDNLPVRWAITLANGDLGQRLIESATLAVREWWPLTCRATTLATWGEIRSRPQRPGETIREYRSRLSAWRDEPVGTRGWVLDEVQRITGAEQVIEFPHDVGIIGRDRVGTNRIGLGPSIIVGAPEEAVDAIRNHLDGSLATDIGIRVFVSDRFDRIG